MEQKGEISVGPGRRGAKEIRSEINFPVLIVSSAAVHSDSLDHGAGGSLNRYVIAMTSYYGSAKPYSFTPHDFFTYLLPKLQGSAKNYY